MKLSRSFPERLMVRVRVRSLPLATEGERLYDRARRYRSGRTASIRDTEVLAAASRKDAVAGPYARTSGTQICCMISAAASKSALSQDSPRRSVLRGHLRVLDAPENRLDKPRTGVSGALQSRLPRFDSGRRLICVHSGSQKRVGPVLLDRACGAA